MTGRDAEHQQVARPNLGYAYLMTGVALGGICISGVLGSIFTPDLVSTSGTAVGYTRQHVPLAAYSGWVFDVIAMAMVLPAAVQGIRAKVTERAPWTVLGVGVAAVWLAVMFVSIFTPRMVTGTAPWLTWVPLGSVLSVVAGLVVTGLLCRTVRKASFERATPPLAPAPAPAPEPEPQAHEPVAAPEATEADAVATLGRLAHLRDAGVISDDEFRAKKAELLTRI